MIWVEKEYNTGIGYTMMINRDGKPDAYYNGSIKEQGRGKPQVVGLFLAKQTQI